MIDKSEFLDLADVHGAHCISIYIPKTGTKKDRIQLKNQLSEVESALTSVYQLKPDAVATKLSSIKELSEDFQWWKNEGSGVSIFIYENQVAFKFFPYSFDPVTYIGDHLYLLPLAPLLHRTQGLHILTISAQEVNLFDATADQIRRNPIASELPQRLEEIVGRDVQQKSLQFRTGQGEADSGMYHGHGAGSDEERKSEYSKFFRAIDKQLATSLKDQHAPLVIACVDYLFPIYRRVSSYQNIYERPLTGNYDQTDPHDLHEDAQSIIRLLEKEKELKRKEKFQEMLAIKSASFDPDDVILAAIEGRIDTLFIQRGLDLYGRYIEPSNTIEYDDEKASNNASLFNLAVIKTIQQRGEVYILDAEEMPERNTSINALFRYNLVT